MDKKTFIKHVRHWDSDIVKKALSANPELANFQDQNGKTPLHHCAEINAAKHGLKVSESVKTAKALISAGADVNALRVIPDDGGEFHARTLWYAIAWGKNCELAKLLLENGADTDRWLGTAVWDQDVKMATLLLSHGAKIDPVFRGETPLLQTVKSRRLKLLDWLVQNGANINFRDDSGYTALHCAVKGTHTIAEVEHLLRLGANPNIKGIDGKTPIDLAAELRKQKLVALLQSRK
ncbi:MAG TPA: ankyrin repeat domain-containing protein [Blastocatellia bacterium]|nr:ankyrin repeat domain-containing protein [Blastocatellia bacterium]